MTNERVVDSGVPWIGSIPASWRVIPFRYVFTESSEVNGQEPVGQMLSVSGYRGVEPKVYDDENRRRTDAELETYRVVRPGQLAVNTMWLNYSGLGVSEHLGHVSPAYRAYSIDPRLDGRYAHHLLRSSVYVNAYTGSLTGIRPNSLQMPRQTLQGWPVLVPPLEEQRRIAEFLDRETAQIDKLIAKQEQLISALAERLAALRTALLDPSLPENRVRSAEWRHLRLKHVVRGIDQGVSPEASAELADETSWGVLKSGCVNRGLFDPRQHKRLDANFGVDPRHVVRLGDFIVNRASGSPDLVGSAAVVKELGYNLMLSDKTFRLRLNPLVSPEYLEHFMQAGLYRDQVLAAISGAGGLANNLPLSALRNFSLPLPPPPVQARIVESLDAAEGAHRAASASADRAIDLLRERRQALISAAVTGQIDVGGGS